MSGKVYTIASEIKGRLDELLAMLQRLNPSMTLEMTWIDNEGGWIDLIYEDGKKPARTTVYSTAVVANGRQIVRCWPDSQLIWVKPGEAG